jgi:hypothetical protein
MPEEQPADQPGNLEISRDGVRTRVTVRAWEAERDARSAATAYQVEAAPLLDRMPPAERIKPPDRPAGSD